MLMAKDENGNEVAPKVGDRFVRLNGGSKYEPFNGEITAVQDDKVSVIGGGYLGGMHYGKWWGDFTSLEHVTIQRLILIDKMPNVQCSDG